MSRKLKDPNRPQTFGAAYKRIDELFQQVAQVHTAERESSAAAVAAQRRASDFSAQFADLKKRLLAAETELAILRGYLARVAEEDLVRHGRMEVKHPNGESDHVPVHPLPLTFLPAGVSVNYETRDYPTDRHSARRQMPHWMEYGNG